MRVWKEARELRYGQGASYWFESEARPRTIHHENGNRNVPGNIWDLLEEEVILCGGLLGRANVGFKGLCLMQKFCRELGVG